MIVATEEKYLTAKEILRQYNITHARLRYYRNKGFLTKIKQTPGRGRTLYNIAEVKQAFHLLDKT